jgi:sugar/nucleoside kinase (ribokinase family)
LIALLEEKGMPFATVQGDVPTPICDIYVTPDGERTMFGSGFKEMDSAADLAAVPFQAGHWFTAEPNMPSVSREAVQRARDAGMRLYLMDFTREGDPIYPGSFWQSSTDWSGHRGNTQQNVDWVRRHVDAFGCFSILSDGPNGFVAGSPEHPVRHYPPFPAPVIVDTTGAGDMFRAGMLFGLSQNWPISDCLRFASAAGCLKCRSLGATSDVPTVAEIQAHIDGNPDVSRHY